MYIYLWVCITTSAILWILKILIQKYTSPLYMLLHKCRKNINRDFFIYLFNFIRHVVKHLQINLEYLRRVCNKFVFSLFLGVRGSSPQDPPLKSVHWLETWQRLRSYDFSSCTNPTPLLPSLKERFFFFFFFLIYQKKKSLSRYCAVDWHFRHPPTSSKSCKNNSTQTPRLGTQQRWPPKTVPFLDVYCWRLQRLQIASVLHC